MLIVQFSSSLDWIGFYTFSFFDDLLRYSSIHVNGQTFGGGNNSKLCSKQAAEVIGGFISDLTTFGMPSKRVVEKSSGINISVNQHQHQTVEIKLIRDLIEDELTGKQVKEIEEVLKEDTPPENKKSKVLQKLKSFGSDVGFKFT